MTARLSDDAHGRIFTLATPAIVATAFLNCKNVQLKDEPPHPPKLAKAYQRRHGHDLVTFKVLDIHPLAKRQVSEHLKAAATEPVKPLHLIRGHFKDYRDHGLFGKLKGVYWWNEHPAGTADNGVAIKDYRIHAPAEQRQLMKGENQ